MPKMKTHSGAKKRFRQTAGGKLRGRHGMTSHIRVKKNAKRQRRIDAPAVISDADRPRVERLLLRR
jgi:large subunit ribosomal protein L35